MIGNEMSDSNPTVRTVSRIRDWLWGIVGVVASEDRSRGAGAEGTVGETDGHAESRLATRLRSEYRIQEAEIVDVVAAHDGEVPQQTIVDRVSCSESTVSRRLNELERDGLLARVSVGREKFVQLPDIVANRRGDRQGTATRGRGGDPRGTATGVAAADD